MKRMEEIEVFDVVVIGSGMVGSACARHLSRHASLKVCLVGPTEPEDIASSKQSNYGSHYDEGRVVRAMDPCVDQGIISQRSLERFRSLEMESGISFYSETGCLVVGQEKSTYMDSTWKEICNLGIQVKVLDNIGLKELMPYFNPGKPCKGFFEPNVGHFSPRGLVKAQRVLAARNGCKLVNDSAEKVEQSQDEEAQVVHLETGGRILGRKVLVATGGFSKYFSGLFSGKELDLEVKTEPIIKCALNDEDVKRLQDMPAIIFKDMDNWNTQYDNSCYILPPIQYPDGKFYIKMGPGLYGKRELCTHEEILRWFRGDILDKEKQFLIRVMNEVLPDIKPEYIESGTCVTTHTPSEHMYIGMISESVGVAIGGNGCSAKSSDELGYIAARMILKGSWDYDIPQDIFLPQFTT